MRRRPCASFLLGRAHGNKTFLVYRDERVSYEAFARAALAIAEACRRAGVRKGDRVAVVMRNLPEWPVGLLWLLVDRRHRSPLNAWWTGPELEYGLADSGAKVAIVDQSGSSGWRSTCTTARRWSASTSAARREEVAHPQVVKLETVIGDVERLEAACRTGRCRTWRSSPRTTPRSSTPRARPASRRARSAPIAIPTSRCLASVRAARTFLRRGEPLPAPDPNAPQKCSLLSVPFFHATGCLRGDGPGARRRRQAGDDAQVGRRAAHAS